MLSPAHVILSLTRSGFDLLDAVIAELGRLCVRAAGQHGRAYALNCRTNVWFNLPLSIMPFQASETDRKDLEKTARFRHYVLVVRDSIAEASAQLPQQAATSLKPVLNLDCDDHAPFSVWWVAVTCL